MTNDSNAMPVKKKVVRWLVVPASLLLIVTAGLVTAGPHFGSGHHGMMNPLERMVDHIDLSESQESEVEAVLNRMKHQDGMKKGFSMMMSMIALDPESDDYDAKVEQQADIMASKMKAKVIAMSAARKDIYAILSAEQKQALNEEISEKLAKMERRMKKRMERHRQDES